MTDNQIYELLVLFNKIENLMVTNGANKTKTDGTPSSFSDKVKSFDNFREKPEKPADIGYKFYFKDNEYHIKDEYEYDKNIEDELHKYELYKSYNKEYWGYKNSLLGGNYNTLIKIGHQRNQLSHSYKYEIKNYRNFVNVCNSMILYLENPNIKRFFKYKILDDSEITNTNITFIKSIKPLSFKKKSKLILADKLFDSIINIKIFIVFIISIILFHYLLKNNITDKYGWVIIPCAIAIYYLPNILLYISKIIINIFMYILSIILEKLVLFIVILLVLNYFGVFSKSDKNDTKTIKESRDNSCSYYYVGTSYLNVRATASKNSKIVDNVQLDEKICITKKEKSWYYIKNQGWVYSKYLTSKKE